MVGSAHFAEQALPLGFVIIAVGVEFLPRVARRPRLRGRHWRDKPPHRSDSFGIEQPLGRARVAHAPRGVVANLHQSPEGAMLKRRIVLALALHDGVNQ